MVDKFNAYFASVFTSENLHQLPTAVNMFCGSADDRCVVAVATGLFLKGAELTPELIQTVTSLKKLVPPRADYFCLADRSVCVAMCTLQC